MVSTAIRSHLNVREEATNLRFPILRSLIPSHVLIVARRNVRSGKSNSDKKSLERMSITNANNKSYLSKRNVRCKVIKVPSSRIIAAIIIASMGLLEEGKESNKAGIVDSTIVVVTVHHPRPHSLTVLVRATNLIITSKY